ncbi:MAG: hypothetical protein ACK4YM_01955 [Novosphingobium sp.]
MSALALALSLLLVGAPHTAGLSGETRTGSRLDPLLRSRANADKRSFDAATLRYIECAVTRREIPLRRALDARTEQQFDKSLDALNNVPRCAMAAYLPEDTAAFNLTSERGTLRGFLAEALIEKYPVKVQQLTPQPIQRSYERSWYPLTGRDRAIDEMATCVAEVNPGGVVKLLSSEIGSAEEKAAVAAIAPSLGSCLAQGYQLNINSLGLRTALAEGLYHRAFDAPEVVK